jgi:hypothetical protein
MAAAAGLGAAAPPAVAAERARLDATPVATLKAELGQRGISLIGMLEKRELVDALLDAPDVRLVTRGRVGHPATGLRLYRALSFAQATLFRAYLAEGGAGSGRRHFVGSAYSGGASEDTLADGLLGHVLRGSREVTLGFTSWTPNMNLAVDFAGRVPPRHPGGRAGGVVVTVTVPPLGTVGAPVFMAVGESPLVAAARAALPKGAHPHRALFAASKGMKEVIVLGYVPHCALVWMDDEYKGEYSEGAGGAAAPQPPAPAPAPSAGEKRPRSS